MFTSVGIIKYDPYRFGLKNSKWWAVVEVEGGSELVRYYRWWVDKEVINPLGIEKGGLAPQSWSPHISIIRGEKPSLDKKHLWKEYDGERVEFQYDLVYNYKIGTNNNGGAPGVFFLVDIYCPFLTNIRKEMGMKYDWNLHLTFGRTYNREQ